ncbi:unnamed protein product [Soboliphyme baturini]|uniref:LRRCT domain-containing protein n=1 Tax=Soboliphyme baturini TaxID=241478 RepID=A0A183IN78_9BILA|nr:unnamed protein product [Soboliphyme baturini]
MAASAESPRLVQLWLLLATVLIDVIASVPCPFNEQCRCSSSDCTQQTDVICANMVEFPQFGEHNSCNVKSLLISGSFTSIPAKAFDAFTNRFETLRIIMDDGALAETPFVVHEKAFQGSVGLMLERLEISNVPTLTELPFALKSLKKLQTLVLNHTSITHIPAEILSKLIGNLVITHSKVSSVDSNAFEGMEFLFDVDLSYNNLSVFPAEALSSVMVNLRQLDLRWNDISSLSAVSFQGYERLNKLLLSGNPLVELPDRLFKGVEDTLIEFVCDDCHLTQFPATALNVLPKIKKLQLRNNNFSRLPRKSFYNMTVLNVVNLDNNPIVTIDYGAFDQAAFSSVALLNTALTELDVGVFSGDNNLNSVNLTRNMLLTKIRLTTDPPLLRVQLFNLTYNNISIVEPSTFEWLRQDSKKMDISFNTFINCSEKHILRWYAAAMDCFPSSHFVITEAKCAMNDTPLADAIASVMPVNCEDFEPTTTTMTTTTTSARTTTTKSSDVQFVDPGTDVKRFTIRHVSPDVSGVNHLRVIVVSIASA